MLNINRFKSTIQKYDVERPNLFDTSIILPRNIPADLSSLGVEVIDPLRLFAQNVTLPGVQITTAPTKRYGLGPDQLMPTGVNFGNTITITYIADAGAKLYSLFYAWLNLLSAPFNPRPAAGVPAIDKDGNDFLNPSFVLAYQSTYVASEMKITTYRGAPGKYGGSGLAELAATVAGAALGAPFIGSLLNGLSNPDFELEPIKTIIVHKAYPISISGQNLSASSADSIATFDVTFAFYNWSLFQHPPATAEQSPGGFFK